MGDAVQAYVNVIALAPDRRDFRRANQEVFQAAKVSSPHRWNGRADPIYNRAAETQILLALLRA